MIWDGVNDPIMGWIVEKVHFKWGKYKPWILIGGLLNTVVVLVLFLAHPKGWGFVALFAVFYFLWDIAWTINDIAYWSMLPSLTKDEKRRNKITAIMQICISVGVFGVYGAVPMLVGAFEGVSAQKVYGVIAIVVVNQKKLNSKICSPFLRRMINLELILLQFYLTIWVAEPL